MARMKSSNSAQVPSVPRLTGEDVVDRVIGPTPAPLLLGEAQADDFRAAAHIVAVIQPKDAIEDFLTRDVIDLDWENRRLRRAKAGLLRAAAGKGVGRILSTLGKSEPIFADFGRGIADRFALEWASGKAQQAQGICGIIREGWSYNGRRHGRGLSGGNRRFRTLRPHACKRGGAPQQRLARDRASPRSSWRYDALSARRHSGCRIP